LNTSLILKNLTNIKQHTCDWQIIRLLDQLNTIQLGITIFIRRSLYFVWTAKNIYLVFVLDEKVYFHYGHILSIISSWKAEALFSITADGKHTMSPCLLSCFRSRINIERWEVSLKTSCLQPRKMDWSVRYFFPFAENGIVRARRPWNGKRKKRKRAFSYA